MTNPTRSRSFVSLSWPHGARIQRARAWTKSTMHATRRKGFDMKHPKYAGRSSEGGEGSEVLEGFIRFLGIDLRLIKPPKTEQQDLEAESRNKQ